ncbi:hypothetical protein PC121_g20943 [Phytophthora cactorum]|nr:hypothetical protein PC121_g20943 [Phytophthora cactorum]
MEELLNEADTDEGDGSVEVGESRPLGIRNDESGEVGERSTAPGDVLPETIAREEEEADLTDPPVPYPLEEFGPDPQKFKEEQHRTPWIMALITFLESGALTLDAQLRVKTLQLAPHYEQMPVQQLSGPFSLMVVDAVGPLVTTPRGNKFSLVFADYFTRWVEAFPVAALDTLTFVIVMIDEVISRHGVPENAYLEWTEYGLVISGCVFVIGLGAHVWRLGDLDGRLEQLSPSSVLTDARASVKSSANARKHQEGTSLRRLRQSEPEEVVLLRDEDDMDNGSGYAVTNNVASTERTTTQPSSTTTTATRWASVLPGPVLVQLPGVAAAVPRTVPMGTGVDTSGVGHMA